MKCSVCNRKEASNLLEIDLCKHERYCWTCFYEKVKQLRQSIPNLTIWGEIIKKDKGEK